LELECVGVNGFYLLLENDKTNDVASPQITRPRHIFSTTKTTYFFKTGQVKTKTTLHQASYAGFAQSYRYYAGNRKKTAYYRLSSQVFLLPKL